jgi:hypothetical protein
MALSLFFLQKSLSMSRTAARFPQLIAGLVLILALAMAFQTWKRAPGFGGEEKEPSAPIHHVRVAVYVAAMVLYIFLIPRLGYFIATPLFMLVSYGYFRATGPVRTVLICLGFPVFIYLLFVLFLKLPIPLGLME